MTIKKELKLTFIITIRPYIMCKTSLKWKQNAFFIFYLYPLFQREQWESSQKCAKSIIIEGREARVRWKGIKWYFGAKLKV